MSQRESALVPAGVVFVGAGPIILDSLFGFRVVPDLDGEIGMGVAVVAVAAFVLLVDFEENFLVEPGLDGGVGFVLAFEFQKFLISFIERVFLVVLHDEACDFLGAVFHALDIEIDFSPYLVFGGAVFFGRIGIGIVSGASMSAGDDHSLSGLFLEIVQKIEKDGINVFLIADYGKAMTASSLAVGARSGFFWVARIDDGGVKGAAFAAEKFFSDPREVGFRFPGIGGPGVMDRGRYGIKKIVLAAVNVFPFAVAAPKFFLLGLFHSRTAKREDKQE